MVIERGCEVVATEIYISCKLLVVDTAVSEERFVPFFRVAELYPDRHGRNRRLRSVDYMRRNPTCKVL